MFLEAYRDALKELGLEEREAVERALEALERHGFAVLRAPTGYGKSFALIPLGYAVYKRLWEEGVAKMIHVLPMGSIAEDLYARALRVFSGTAPADNVDLGELEKAVLEKYGRAVVGFQAWSIDADFKDPLFIRSSLIYSTFDSFVLNLFKITPLRSARAPYEAARAAIMRAVVVFDEAHLLAEVGGGEGRAVSALLAALRSLRHLKVPVLVATATIPTALVRILREGEGAVVTALGDGCSYKGAEWEVVVGDYKPRGRVEVKVADGVDVVKALREYSFRKALLVFNTVKRAVEVYEKLAGSYNAVLLHGRLSIGDRRRGVEGLKRAEVVVATQVVEAGVELSADLMVTDIAPLPSLIQRFGRVARSGGEGVALIDIGGEALERASAVYGEEPVKLTLELLKRRDYRVDWRDPCPTGGGSYGRLLEEYGEKIYRHGVIDSEYVLLLQSINDLVLRQRGEARRLLEALCSFVRGTAAVPVIVSEDCLSRSDPRGCLLMLDASRAESKYFVRDGEVKVAVEGLDKCLDRCKCFSNGLAVCNMSMDVLFTSCGDRGLGGATCVNCRRLLSLDYFVSAELGRRVSVLGVVALSGYREGLGWVG
jgi:CRISPR-associated endonuclease/helicase Cas3